MSLKVVFFGTPKFAVPTLEALLASNDITLLGVVTQPDKRRGRGGKLMAAPIKELAQLHGLTVWQPPRLKKCPETLAALQKAQADVFVVVAYGQLLPLPILELPLLGCINVHGSLLPRYRGAAPLQWSLFNGDLETGVTTMMMDQGMDTGPMLLKSTFAIPALMNAEELGEQLSTDGAKLLIATLQQLERQAIEPTPQPEEQATYAPLLKKEDFSIDWARSAVAIHNQVRGFYPHCGSLWRQQNIKILQTVPLLPEYLSALPQGWGNQLENLNLEPQASVAPGTLVALAKKMGPVVQTGNGLLLIREIQMAGKKNQSGWDWVNGQRLELGEVLASLS
jgi:methionyl-tRNA formyltransferase